jgi:hypothetical protein
MAGAESKPSAGYFNIGRGRQDVCLASDVAALTVYEVVDRGGSKLLTFYQRRDGAPK